MAKIEKIKKSKYSLFPSEQKMCHGIIHTASGSAAAVGAGLAQLPLADNAVITPIQITMIISLGGVFEQKVTKTAAKALLGGFIANFVGRGVAQAAWGWIPGIGNASNAVTAAAITESIGWLCVDHFYKEKYLLRKNSNNEEQSKQEIKENPIKADNGKIKGDNDEKEKLKKRAQEFINEEKNKEDHMKEFEELIEDISDYLTGIEDKSDELHQYLNKLMALF